MSEEVYALLQDPELVNYIETLEGPEMLNELKTSVVELLMTEYEFLLDEADEAVEKSVEEDPDMWSDNAEARDLAEYLASEDSGDVD